MRKPLLLLGIVMSLLLAASPAFAQSVTVIATVKPNPLNVQVSAPATVPVGQWFDVTLTVTNQGLEIIDQTTATLNTPAEITVRGNKNKRLGKLLAGQVKTVDWQAKATTAGNFIIQANVVGEIAGEQISQSDSTIISAASPLGFFLFRILFGI